MQATPRKTLQQRLLFPQQLDVVAFASTISAATEARTGPIPQDPRNRRADWASSNSDVRHRVNLAATYLLPFGPGRPICESGWSRLARSLVVGRSAESPCCRAVCHLPSPCRVLHRIPVTPAAPIPLRESDPEPANKSINLWFDPAAFTTPPAFTWGTLGRNTLNAPALYNLDFSITKKFRFSESRELQFRSEFFNGLNHPQFGLPNSTIGVGGAGTITSTQRANRQMQFALRFSF